MALHATCLAAMYSAYTKLSATNLYFLLYQEIAAEPRLKIPPEVLFRSNGLPTQSTSVNPWSFTPSVRLYHNPY